MLACRLALEDGTVAEGVAVGAAGTSTGEVVFNTAMCGYQEVFTDPSYCGQIVTMTFPLMGNYGINNEDDESAATHLAGVVLHELPRRPSNYRATLALDEFLQRRGVVGLAGVDTRALTRRIRTAGAMRGALSTEIDDPLELLRLARAAEPIEGADLVQRVAADGPARRLGPPAAPLHVVVLDCGIKAGIVAGLVAAGCRVSLLGPRASADAICACEPDGVVVGNGPGDPAAVHELCATLRSLLGRRPMLGICLGHQLLALALGARTYKLRFGHHGVNVPVLNRPAGRVEITSQNHGFAVDAESLQRVGAAVTHVNLNDGSVEGFVHAESNVLGVQFHPEARPGPHDAGYLLAGFVGMLGAGGRVGELLAAGA